MATVFGDHRQMVGEETTGRVRRVCLRESLFALVLLACGGCHQDNHAPPPVAAKPKISVSAPLKSGPTPEQLTAGMVEAAVQGKAGLALKLKFELAQRPKVGQPLEINLALIPQIAGGPLSIQVTASDGIVSSTGESYELPGVELDQVYRHTLRLTPVVEGVLLVALNISLKHDDVTDTTVFSIPIIADK